MWDANRPGRSVARFAALAYVLGFIAWRVLSSGPPLNVEPGPDSSGQYGAAVRQALSNRGIEATPKSPVTLPADTANDPSSEPGKALTSPDSAAPQTSWNRPRSESAD